MRILKHIINWSVWTILGLYALTMAAVNTPWVQQRLGGRVALILGETLGTSVSVGRIDLGFLNRIIIDDLVVLDQHRRPLLRAARVTAKVDLSPLAFGRISVSSAQVFGAHLRLARQTADSPLNIQFVLDSLASNDTTKSTPIDLRIGSFVMRHSSVSYDQWDTPVTPDALNPCHLNLLNISAHVILKALQEDSLNINVKRLTMMEQSGLNLRRLAFQLEGGRRQACLHDLLLQLPDTEVRIDTVTARYDLNRLAETLTLQGRLGPTVITPSDLRFAVPALKKYQRHIRLDAAFSIADSTLTVPRFAMESAEGDLKLSADGRVRLPRQQQSAPWLLNLKRLHVGETTIDFVSKNLIPLPEPVLRLGSVLATGNFSGDAEGTLRANADVETDMGSISTRGHLRADRAFNAAVSTEGIDLGRLLDSKQFGIVATNMEIDGMADRQMAAQGTVSRFDYGGNTYQNITIDGRYDDHHIAGNMSIDDPKLTARLDLDVNARSLNDAVGTVSLRKLSLPEKDYRLDYLRLESGFDEGRHYVTLNSDFAHADLVGEFDYSTLAQSVANAIGARLPTLPALPPPTNTTSNNFSLHLQVAKTDWLQRLLGIDLDVSETLTLDATVNDRSRQLMLDLRAPAFSYGSNQFRATALSIASPSDTLTVSAALSNLQDNGQPLDVRFSGHAADNKLQFALHWDNNQADKPVSGTLNAAAEFYTNFDRQSEAHVMVLPSDVHIDNSVWQVEPSDILYSADRLLVDHFTVHNQNQYVTVNGRASERPTDSLKVDLSGVEVAYILDLVGFDAVSFSGLASGRAYLSQAFAEPDAHALLTVSDFKFQDGRMGTLTARVGWNKRDKQIDIDGTCNDGPEATTYINGYVSPERDFIDLGIAARGTYLDFMHSWTDSFISHITGHGTGDLRLAGPLSAINLTGRLIVSGEATVTPLNCTYRLPADTLQLTYNHIVLDRQPLIDRAGNRAYLSGGIHHEDLTNLSLDLHVSTDRFLSYDFRDFGDQSFYGTVFAAGDVDIRMKGDDVYIDCDVTPLKNTVFVYNAAQADAITSQEFITWKKNNSTPAIQASTLNPQNSTTNIYMTFLVNVDPDATMQLLMDARTGDYITLAGNGTLQATYYNKGAFQMQGTYTIDNGTYDITIQNIINKKFQFQQGGTIVFGGDPYDAALNLQAMYTVNGASLSDLNIGNSFSSNTVRVNCLMNIGGQPSAPQVTFDLDLPNVNADEKQMVRQLLSSQQEMNQQVLYLLGIGRFYNQGQNNAQQQQQDQTSLAMNSFLSGTLSTQINNVINQIVKNDDWNFGANISTGTEGWNNAEYEGIINGRMLNNRLLINGQFGYRDNATQASPSFIGDFDVRYLLTPNGNYALKVYNQTNDRYFTRSSLNTQGVGIILKRDFNGLHDFFGIKKEK